MLNRMRKFAEEREQGFTLIELLVVIIIIGILAAIAIPVFLNQRKKGVDASLKNDLRNAAMTVESYATDNPSTAIPAATASTTGAGVATAGTGSLAGFRASPGNSVKVKAGSTGVGSFLVCVWNAGSTGATAVGTPMVYDSNAGGVLSALAASDVCA